MCLSDRMGVTDDLPCFVLSIQSTGSSIDGANIYKICMRCYPFVLFFAADAVIRSHRRNLHHVQYAVVIHLKADVVTGKGHAVYALGIVMIGGAWVLLQHLRECL